MTRDERDLLFGLASVLRLDAMQALHDAKSPQERVIARARIKVLDVLMSPHQDALNARLAELKKGPFQ